uniref:Uncharacterized protein n=1 Tax=Catagonus wagneri TaxID=51154 RepID=A0A8C3WKU0_9CETA
MAYGSFQARGQIRAVAASHSHSNARSEPCLTDTTAHRIKPASSRIQKVSRSEEFLTRISTELTDEALFIAAYHTSPVSTKEKQMQDRGTQISKHVFFTKPRGTDTQ